MDGPQAPKQYTPEHCAWVEATLSNKIQTAIDTLALVSKGQDDLTKQAIADLSDSLEEIKDDIADLRLLKTRIQSFRIWIASGVISGLILIIGGLFKIFSLLKGIPVK